MDFFQDPELLKFIENIPPTHLMLSGGEPLIHPGVKELVKKGGRLGHKFSFTTNLCIPLNDLTELLDYWEYDSIGSFMISHHHVAGISFDYIQKRVDLLSERGINVYVKYICVPEFFNDIDRDIKKWQQKGVNSGGSALFGVWNGKYYPADYTLDEAIKVLTQVNIYHIVLQVFVGIYSKDIECRYGYDMFLYNQQEKKELVPCCNVASQYDMDMKDTYFMNADAEKNRCSGEICASLEGSPSYDEVIRDFDTNKHLVFGESVEERLGKLIQFLEAIQNNNILLADTRRYYDIKKYYNTIKTKGNQS
jgi:hypothetical protein